MLGSFIGRWANVLASKSRSPRFRFGGNLPAESYSLTARGGGRAPPSGARMSAARRRGKGTGLAVRQRGEGVRMRALAAQLGRRGAGPRAGAGYG